MSGLKKDLGAIQRAVQILAGTYDKDVLSFEVAKVKSVDTRNWLCTAQLVSSPAQTTYTDIHLTAEKASNGFIQVPKVCSNVILATTFRKEKYVLLCSEIDALVFHQKNSDGTYEQFTINCNSTLNPSLPLGIQLTDGGGNGVTVSSRGIITMNNGSYGGLTKTQVLQAQLNKMNSQLQAVISALSNWTPVPDDGGAALKTYFAGAIITTTPADFSDIENTNVTHGPSVS